MVAFFECAGCGSSILGIAVKNVLLKNGTYYLLMYPLQARRPSTGSHAAGSWLRSLPSHGRDRYMHTPMDEEGPRHRI